MRGQSVKWLAAAVVASASLVPAVGSPSAYDDTVRTIRDGARAGNVAEVRSAVRAARGFSDRRPAADLAMREAASAGRAPVLRALLADGAHADPASRIDLAPLAAAAAAGHLDCMRVLLAHGARVNGWGTIREPPLTAAARSGQVDAMRFLLKHGADANASSAVIAAASTGHIDAMRLLLARGAGPNGSGPGGSNPLAAAAAVGHMESVWFLLARGASTRKSEGLIAMSMPQGPDYGASGIGRDLLTGAARPWVARERNDRARRLAMVRFLAARGADMNGRFRGRTPLMYAARNSDGATARLLLKLGADADAVVPAPRPTIRRRRTPGPDRTFVRPEEVREAGWTPLLFACDVDAVPVVRELLAVGANPNAMSAKGETPLAVACGLMWRFRQMGTPDPDPAGVVRLLTAHGVRVDGPDARAALRGARARLARWSRADIDQRMKSYAEQQLREEEIVIRALVDAGVKD